MILVWCIATSDFVVFAFTLFLGLAFTGSSASVSCHSCILSLKKGIMVSLPSRLRGHIEHYNGLELLGDSGYDMNLSFLAVHTIPIDNG